MHPMFDHFKPETIAWLKTLRWETHPKTLGGAVVGGRCDCPLGHALRYEGKTADFTFPHSQEVVKRLGLRPGEPGYDRARKAAIDFIERYTDKDAVTGPHDDIAVDEDRYYAPLRSFLG